MMKEIEKIVSEIIDYFGVIIEFCRNNLNMWAVGAIALLVVLAFIVLSAAIKALLAPKKSELVVAVAPEEPAPDEPKVEEAQPEKITLDEPKVAEVVEEEPEYPKEEPKDAPEIARNTSCLEDIIGELVTIPTEDIKEIEIKIQGAEVKVTYANNESLQLISKELVARKNAAEESLEVEEEAERVVAESLEDEDYEEPKTLDISEEQGKATNKFGPNNINVSKSGRVYSEEELQEQIKD